MLSTIVGILVLTGAIKDNRTAMLVVVGAAGDEEYGIGFGEWASRWQQAGLKARASVAIIGSDKDPRVNDLEALEVKIAGAQNVTQNPLWLVMIGHGTFDGRDAKFNLRGPDLTASRLGELLRPMTRPVIVINCASASGPFINAISGPSRAIVTATKSGEEQNLTRFGDYLSRTVNDPQSDLDKDGQVSLLEAFLSAASKTSESYKAAALLQTEHPLIDDDGDGLGTPAEWFRGVHATRRTKYGSAVDGVRSHQFCLMPGQGEISLSEMDRQRRNALELQIASLRAEKANLEVDIYYERLEPLMIELAEVYRLAE